MSTASQENQEETPKNKFGYGPLAAVVVSIGVFFSSQFLAGLFIVLPLLILAGGAESASSLYARSTVAKFATFFLTGFFTLYLLKIFLGFRKMTFKNIGLIKPKLNDLWYPIVALFVYYFILIIAINLVTALIPGFNASQRQEIGFDTNVEVIMLPLIFISLVVVPAVSEEILCRGFLYSGLKTKLPKILAAIITSILFALAHLQWGSGNALLWVAAVDTFVLSMVLVYLRDKTGGLTSPIILHGLKNGLAFMTLFVFGG